MGAQASLSHCLRLPKPSVACGSRTDHSVTLTTNATDVVHKVQFVSIDDIPQHMHSSNTSISSEYSSFCRCLSVTSPYFLSARFVCPVSDLSPGHRYHFTVMSAILVPGTDKDGSEDTCYSPFASVDCSTTGTSASLLVLSPSGWLYSQSSLVSRLCHLQRGQRAGHGSTNYVCYCEVEGN